MMGASGTASPSDSIGLQGASHRLFDADEEDIGRVLLGHRDGLNAVAGLADDGEVGQQ